MPLITIFILVVSRSRLKKSQVMAEDWLFVSPERSTPSYMGLRARVSVRAAAVVASRTFARVGALQPGQGSPDCGHQRDRQSRRLGKAPRLFRACHEVLWQPPIYSSRRVGTRSARRARGGDIFHRAGRDCGENLQMVADFRRLARHLSPRRESRAGARPPAR